jgi:hypothetical protein
LAPQPDARSGARRRAPIEFLFVVKSGDPLDALAQDFEPGRHYTEKEVNDSLGAYHADVAALRRYLIDEGYLDRDAGATWRAGT